MLHAVQLGYAFNGNNVGTGAAHTRTHLVKIVGKVYNFRFFGRIFQNRGTICHCCCHHNIFGCAHTRKIEVNIGTGHAFRRRSFNIAMPLFNFYAQCFKTFQVQINRPCADSAAPWLGNTGITLACQERPHNKERSAHGTYKLIRRFAGGNFPAVNFQRMRLGSVNFDAKAFQDRANCAHILQRRNFIQPARRSTKNRSGNNRQHGIFGAACFYCAYKAVAAFNYQSFQLQTLLFLKSILSKGHTFQNKYFL